MKQPNFRKYLKEFKLYHKKISEINLKQIFIFQDGI